MISIPGLLPSQTAGVVRAISGSSFQLTDFEVEEYDFGLSGFAHVPAVRHLPTGARFGFGRKSRARGYAIRTVEDSLAVALNPGRDTRVQIVGVDGWSSVSPLVTEWLSNLRRELDAEAYLAGALQADSARSTAAASEDERLATTAEQVELSSRLDALEIALSQSIEGAEDRQRVLLAEFAALREELSRMRKGRWRKLVVGTLVGLATDAVVPAAAIQSVIREVRDLFADLCVARLPPTGP